MSLGVELSDGTTDTSRIIDHREEWLMPPPGWVEINIDVSFSSNINLAFLSVISRSAERYLGVKLQGND